MKNIVILVTTLLCGLYLDAAFVGSPIFSHIFIVPGSTLCFWLVTEQLRKDRLRAFAIIIISLLYGLVVNVNIGLLVISVSGLFGLRLLLGLSSSSRVAESEMLQSLGFFYLFTLGLSVVNNQNINFVVVTLVVLLNCLISWCGLQLLKSLLRTSSYV